MAGYSAVAEATRIADKEVKLLRLVVKRRSAAIALLTKRTGKGTIKTVGGFKAKKR